METAFLVAHKTTCAPRVLFLVLLACGVGILSALIADLGPSVSEHFLVVPMIICAGAFIAVFLSFVQRTLSHRYITFAAWSYVAFLAACVAAVLALSDPDCNEPWHGNVCWSYSWNESTNSENFSNWTLVSRRCGRFQQTAAHLTTLTIVWVLQKVLCVLDVIVARHFFAIIWVNITILIAIAGAAMVLSLPLAVSRVRLREWWRASDGRVIAASCACVCVCVCVCVYVCVCV